MRQTSKACHPIVVVPKCHGLTREKNTYDTYDGDTVAVFWFMCNTAECAPLDPEPFRSSLKAYFDYGYLQPPISWLPNHPTYFLLLANMPEVVDRRQSIPGGKGKPPTMVAARHN